MNTSVQAKPNQVYVFCGEDDYLLLQEARNLITKLMPPEQQTLGLEKIEGSARIIAEALTSVAACIEAVRTPGFMGARKVIWLRGANYLDRSVIARSKDVTAIIDSLSKIIKAGLPAGNIFVVTAGVFDKASVFFKACQARGEIYQQAALKPWDKDRAAAAFARSVLQKHKLQASQDVIAAIVDLVGTDSRQLAQEVSKLALFIHPRQQANVEDVLGIVSAARESTSFNLADAVGSRDLPKAVTILRQLLFQKESEIGMVMGLEYRFHYLLILKEMTAGKITDEERKIYDSLLVSDKGRIPHEYFLKRWTEQARQFTFKELEKARDAILETRLKLVSTSGLEKILLDELLVKLCGRKKQPAKAG